MEYTYTTARAVVRVHRPELTQEERDKRMVEIKKAATALIVAQMRARQKATA